MDFKDYFDQELFLIPTYGFSVIWTFHGFCGAPSYANLSFLPSKYPPPVSDSSTLAHHLHMFLPVSDLAASVTSGDCKECLCARIPPSGPALPHVFAHRKHHVCCEFKEVNSDPVHFLRSRHTCKDEKG